MKIRSTFILFIIYSTLLSNEIINIDLITTNDLHGVIPEQKAYFMNPQFPPTIIGSAGFYNYINENIPVNIQYLFNLYSEELLEIKEGRSESDENIASEWEYFLNPIEYEPSSRNVSPLISARFDQGSAWNDMCPEDPDGPGGNALVGCVAVSMAQVMHYWSYPEVGYGSHGYNHWDYGYQYADFGNSYYDYSEMQNNYATSESQELLFHCGVSVNMGYGADGSGANVFGGNPSTEFAMKNYFLFENDLNDIEPWQYSSSQYREILQNELNNFVLLLQIQNL